MTANKFDKSEATARLMFEKYVESVVAALGDSIEAILLVGSLVTGSYVPGPGDIDQITILRRTAPDDAEARVLQCIDDTAQAFGRAVSISSVVYRKPDFERPWITDWDLSPETKHLVTVPEELLRIHDHGRIVYGDLAITSLPIPTVDEMVAYHERWRVLNEECQKRHPEIRRSGPLTARLAAQSILSSAIWHYYFATGRTCFNKHEIAWRLQEEVVCYRFQEGVQLAADVRISGFVDISNEILKHLNDCCRELAEWGMTHPIGAVPIQDKQSKIVDS